jgi:hypothetical protein
MGSSSLGNYRYFIVNPTESLTSSVGATINGAYYSEGKSANPRDIISGYLIKRGLVVLTEKQVELLGNTVVVNYGESGRRDVAFGYTTEVTLQFIAADTNQIVGSSTAEGIGSTEVDDVRIAIKRALDAIFGKVSQ